MRRSIRPARLAIVAACGLSAATSAAQTVFEPGWTVSTFVSGLLNPLNGLEKDCVGGDFWVTDNLGNAVYQIDSLGGTTVWDLGMAPDELALDRSATLLVAQFKSGPNRVYTTTGTFLGSWTEPLVTVTGLAFDSSGDLFAGTWTRGEVWRYPRASLPPGTPTFSVWATGLGGIEGMRFSCDDHLFAADYSGGNVFEVVPPAGPHVTWASGLDGPLSVAIDPCTGSVFISNLGDGTIVRATAPGVFAPFATGFALAGAIVFDPDGNLFVTEPGGGRIVKLAPPRTCGSPLAGAGPDQGVCAGAATTLDGSSTTGCSGGSLLYRWLDGSNVVCDWSSTSTCAVTPSAATVYTLEVACNGVCGCTIDRLDTVTVTALPGPVASLEPPDPMCPGESRTLDANGSSPGTCPAGVEYQFREGAIILRAWDALATFGPVSPPATTVYAVDARCVGSTTCESSATQALVVDVDIVPGDLGNSLRAVRQSSDVSMSWASLPEARSYALHRALAKGSWPGPAWLSLLPTTVATLNDVPAPPSLYFYRVAGESCSGREGP